MGLPIIGDIIDGIFGIGTKYIDSQEKQAEFKKEITEKLIDYDTQLVTQVNQTMQAEAKSEHWAQWLWRPMIGFTFSAVIINNYVLAPYLVKYIQPIMVPDQLWNAMLVILGAAAATRGWQKVVEAQNGNGGSFAPGVLPPPSGNGGHDARNQ